MVVRKEALLHCHWPVLSLWLLQRSSGWRTRCEDVTVTCRAAWDASE